MCTSKFLGDADGAGSGRKLLTDEIISKLLSKKPKILSVVALHLPPTSLYPFFRLVILSYIFAGALNVLPPMTGLPVPPCLPHFAVFCR